MDADADLTERERAVVDAFRGRPAVERPVEREVPAERRRGLLAGAADSTDVWTALRAGGANEKRVRADVLADERATGGESS